MKFCDHQSNNVPRIHKIKRSFFIKIGLRKIIELNIILTAHFGQALNTKKTVRELSKKDHKVSEAEKFVFIY